VLHIFTDRLGDIPRVYVDARHIGCLVGIGTKLAETLTIGIEKPEIFHRCEDTRGDMPRNFQPPIFDLKAAENKFSKWGI